MATRGKPRRRKWRKSASEQPQPPKQEQAQAPPAPPAEQKTAEPDGEAKPTNVIRKGIYLSALIYVEGDMPAPDDFISPTTKALESVLDRALKGEHDGLSMTLKKVEVQNDVEQEDGEEEDAEDSGREEKFQF